MGRLKWVYGIFMNWCLKECFIDYRELSRFIAAGRLNCKIDKVGGIVETNRPDSKNYQYQVRDNLMLSRFNCTFKNIDFH